MIRQVNTFDVICDNCQIGTYRVITHLDYVRDKDLPNYWYVFTTDGFNKIKFYYCCNCHSKIYDEIAKAREE